MKYATKDFQFKGTTLRFSNREVDFNSTFIYLSKFHVGEVSGEKIEIESMQAKNEYYADIEAQLRFLEDKELNDLTFFDAFIESCFTHVERVKRIIMGDMHSYLDCCMHIMEVTQGKFHSLIPDSESATLLRHRYVQGCIYVLQDHMFVSHPTLKDESGMSKLIAYKDLPEWKKSNHHFNL